MNLQQAKDLVLHYCNEYDIHPNELFKTWGKSSKPAKVIRGIHVDFMRMALGHYITVNFPLYSQEIAKLIGYRDRSSISSNERKTIQYISMRDPYFIPYWDKITEIGELYKPKQNFFKTHNGFIREVAA